MHIHFRLREGLVSNRFRALQLRIRHGRSFVCLRTLHTISTRRHCHIDLHVVVRRRVIRRCWTIRVRIGRRRRLRLDR